MNSTYLYRKHLLRRGSRESDQNQRPVRLKGGCINWWSWFQLWYWREDIGGKEWRVKVARKDESRFTIYRLCSSVTY